MLRSTSLPDNIKLLISSSGNRTYILSCLHSHSNRQSIRHDCPQSLTQERLEISSWNSNHILRSTAPWFLNKKKYFLYLLREKIWPFISFKEIKIHRVIPCLPIPSSDQLNSTLILYCHLLYILLPRTSRSACNSVSYNWIYSYLRHMCVTLNARKWNIYPHLRKWNIYLNVYFYFFTLVSRQSAALSFAIKRAMPLETEEK